MMNAWSLASLPLLTKKQRPQVARGAPGQRLRQGGPLRRQELRRDTAGTFRLPLDRLDYPAVAVAEVRLKKLRQEIEIAATMPVVEVDAVAVVEFQHGVFALLDRPG